ncbi:hypothetical protein LR48_Vigan07g124700 [Vigna angularis]|uniref:Ubiquitin-like protease family profile domain-containing protein n=1 Tax=Phaseolus angularis TaxID=3914 RepID=A0A0L9UXQ2_PHAAN|nr:hypothetical protein LR48_Vigan07g124700 [Vigna angularis]
MDDEGMVEGSLPKPSRVEEAGIESSNDNTWEVGAQERMRKNNKKNHKIECQDWSYYELIKICQTPIFNEEVTCGNDEEGGGGAHETPVGGGDEEIDGGFDEEVVGGAVEDPGGAFNEQAGDDEPVHEDDKVSASHHPSVCIEIDGNGDDDDEGEVPLAIPPLRSYVGDPTSTVDVDELYYAASIRDRPHRVVRKIIGQTVSITSCYTLAPLEYVDNMVVLFATTIFMHFEKRSYGVVKRILFSPLYGFFMPFEHDDHWWCYLVKLSTLQIFVIDSLGRGIKDRKRIEKFVAENVEGFFRMLYNRPEGSIGPLAVEQANIPSQPNLHDCGIIMLKAMKILDGEKKYNGKSMPQYTNEELLGIRKKYVWD